MWARDLDFVFVFPFFLFYLFFFGLCFGLGLFIVGVVAASRVAEAVTIPAYVWVVRRGGPLFVVFIFVFFDVFFFVIGFFF